MTQHTTKKDKREQSDTKHNTLKIYLTRNNLLHTLFLQPMRQQVLRWNSLVIFCLVAFAPTVDTTRSFDCPEG
jgi:hypothetical protein